MRNRVVDQKGLCKTVGRGELKQPTLTNATRSPVNRLVRNGRCQTEKLNNEVDEKQRPTPSWPLPCKSQKTLLEQTNCIMVLQN